MTSCVAVNDGSGELPPEIIPPAGDYGITGWTLEMAALAKTVEECESIYRGWQQQNPNVAVDWIGCEAAVAMNSPDYVDPNVVTFDGYALKVEKTDQMLNVSDRDLVNPAEPLIKPLSDGLLVQFYGSSSCPPGIWLSRDFYGTTAIGSVNEDQRDDKFLVVSVNYNYAMEQDPQLMACTDDLARHTFRIVTEIENDLGADYWNTVAERARWAESQYDEAGNQFLELHPFVIADEILVGDKPWPTTRD